MGYQQGQQLADIKTQANAALLWGIVGIFCFGFVLGPAAIIRGGLAKSRIAQHNVGHDQAGKATAGQALGALALVLWLAAIAFRVLGARL